MLARSTRTRAAARLGICALLACTALLASSSSAFAASGQITGTVTDASNGHPLGGVIVDVYDPNDTSTVLATTTSDPTTGGYTVGGLPTGTYNVYFKPGTGQNYMTQAYNGKTLPAKPIDPVSVTDGQATDGIDAAMQPGGEITGIVNDETSDVGAAGVIVTLADSSNEEIDQTTTDGNGSYTFDRLPTGTYYVCFTPNDQQNYVFQCWEDKGPGESATPIMLTVGQTVHAGATMHPGGMITGKVTDAVTHQPIAGVYVGASGAVNSGTTDQNGDYTVKGAPTGDHTMYFRPAARQNYLPLSYGGPVSTTAGQTTSNVNVELQPGAKIVGRVIDAVTHQPISDAYVSLYDSTDEQIEQLQTNSRGLYSFVALDTGSYRVGFSANFPDYVDQYYDGKATLAGANVLSLTVGQTMSGIDGLLTRVQHTLSVTTAGTGSGSVTATGISCPGTCSNHYGDQTQVTLLAHPHSGSVFTGWSGACSGAHACSVTMTDDLSVVAKFTELPHVKIDDKTVNQTARKASFAWVARGAKALGYECTLIKRKPHHTPTPDFKGCTSPKTYKELTPGSYRFEVRAFSSLGTGPAAQEDFKIK